MHALIYGREEAVKDSAGAGKRGTPFDYSLIYPYYVLQGAYANAWTQAVGIVCTVRTGIPYR